MDKKDRLRLLPLRLSEVYYGWWIVVACFLIAFYTGGSVFFSFTAIFEPIASEFGWSYAQVSFAASLRGMEIGLLAPVVGMLVDRWGARRLMFIGISIASLGLYLLSKTNSLGMFYGAYLMVAVGVSSGTTTVTMATVAGWFRRKIGIATGIMICGYGSSGLIIPLVVKLIDVYGWRTTMVIQAIGMIVICIPLVLLLRHRPEQYGLLPDGEVRNPSIIDNESAPPAEDAGFSAKQALKSRAFWHITGGFLTHMMAVHTVITHVMPYLSSIGVERAAAGLAATAIPLISVGGRFGFGWISDKMSKKKITFITFSMLAVGALLFELLDSVGIWLLVPFLVLFGLGYGGNVTMSAVMPVTYFGRKNFGAIIGFINGFMILGSISGPPLAGWVFDTWGSYQSIWFIFAGLVTIGNIILLTAPPVRSTR